MIELNVFLQFIQSVGVAAAIVAILAGIWFYMTRGGYVSSKADADTQSTMTRLALMDRERSIALEDHRYRNLKQSTKLMLRIQSLEVSVREVPGLRTEVKELREKLERAIEERDEALRENARLEGRIEVLEQHIKKLEDELRRLRGHVTDDETAVEEDIDRTNPLIEYRHIRGRGTGRPTRGNRGDDDDSGDDGDERDGDPTG